MRYAVLAMPASSACSPIDKRVGMRNPSLAKGHFAVMIEGAKPLGIAAKSRPGAAVGRLTFSRSRGYSHHFVAI
jgi:hypothetical protein